jgi:cyclopropane fatty-acyl-phospholipid synthase-like methyltransferase
LSQHKTEQLYLYTSGKHGIPATKSDDPLLVFRHYQRYLLALTFGFDLETKEWALDIGSGSGYGTELISRHFRNVIGVDADIKAVEYARDVHNRGENVSYIHGGHVRAYDVKFDFITALEVIEHMEPEQGERLIATASKHLSDNGVCVITTPIKEGTAEVPESSSRVPNPWHKHEYSKAELEKVCFKYFEDVQAGETSMGTPEMTFVCRGPKHVD